MSNQQTTFKPDEAVAICEMIARLASENYTVAISYGEEQDDHANEGHVFRPFVADVVDAEKEILISWGNDYSLIEALDRAWMDTPEGEKEDE